MKKISIVIPIYFNEGNIPVLAEALYAEIDKLRKDFLYEIIFIDDGSKDQSFSELMKLFDNDRENVKIIKFSRNFGQVAAVQAGFEAAEGDAVISMSADLQDPPALIQEFVRYWSEEGCQIVLGAREDREDGFFAKGLSVIFYSLMRKFAVRGIPPGGFDFFLISRKVLDIIVRMEEKNTFVQGQILWTGFEPKIISYLRRRREIGRSRWTYAKKIKYFIDGFMTYSYLPIRFISVTGIVTAFLGFLYAAVIFAAKLTVNNPIKGWAPLMIVILVLSGLQMTMLGIIGEYLWRNYDETRKRPIFIIDKIISE